MHRECKGHTHLADHSLVLCICQYLTHDLPRSSLSLSGSEVDIEDAGLTGSAAGAHTSRTRAPPSPLPPFPLCAAIRRLWPVRA